MIKLLIVGYSSIVQKKALKGISCISFVESIDIASVSRNEEAKQNDLITGTVFDNYDQAFKESKATVTYISTVNSTHGILAKKALEYGMHVVVDKPSFLSEEEVLSLSKLAKEKKLCLAEATIYTDHPQIIKAKEIFENSGSIPDKISSVFSFPPYPDKSVYKYDVSLGGGAILDVGPYALTPGRVFFGAQPISIYCVITHRDPGSNIDTSFSMMAIYPENRTIVGHYGFDSAYKSHISLIGSKVTVDMTVPFSPPSFLENELIVNQENNWTKIKCEKGDNFTLYFERVFSDIESKKFEYHNDLLVEDFYVLKMLRESAGL